MDLRNFPFLICWVALGSVLSVEAKPTGSHVKKGEANLTHLDGSRLLIQSQGNTVIDWEAFSIALGEQVRFEQANGGAC